jgi:hypothetical protein
MIYSSLKIRGEQKNHSAPAGTEFRLVTSMPDLSWHTELGTEGKQWGFIKIFQVTGDLQGMFCHCFIHS